MTSCFFNVLVKNWVKLYGIICRDGNPHLLGFFWHFLLYFRTSMVVDIVVYCPTNQLKLREVTLCDCCFQLL